MNWNALPVAGPVPQVFGDYRTAAADFVVEECSPGPLDGEGEHLYLWVEKRGQNTRWVAQRLAQHFAVQSADVGYAGLKDRHAVARQWFSVRLPAHENLPTDNSDGFTVLGVDRHRRKLRPGDHGGNRFELRLRHLTGDLPALRERLSIAAEAGLVAPNYFGPQRFGHDGGNIERARRWLIDGERRGLRRSDRGILMSAARALVFNQVLAGRVGDGTWDACVAGDIGADGITAADGALEHRDDGASACDSETMPFPTGPLWGRGRSATTGAAAQLEARWLQGVAEWLNPLEHCGLNQERRPLAVAVAGFTVSWDGNEPTLGFTLPAGSFATSVLRELGHFDDRHARAA